MWIQVLLLIVGFGLLYYGAEWLVKGSASLARSLGVSPVVIGLTVVAFGTSSPELVVSVVSSIGGKSMIAVGNVVGSNICNIALVLGIAALVMPLTADRSVIRRDIPLMLAISVYLLIISANSYISRFEGVTLFAGVILYTLFNYRVSAKEVRMAEAESGALAGVDTDGSEPELEHAKAHLSKVAAEIEEIGIVESRVRQIVLIVAGIAGVIIGANVLIGAAEVIMKVFGVSEKFIGLTVVALGTSLPELATSIVAAMRKEMDISIGNLVGSNVFNILCVIGASGMVRPLEISGGFFQSGLIFDYLVMMLTSSLPLLFMMKDCTIRRSGGLTLLCCYFGFIAYQVCMG